MNAMKSAWLFGVIFSSLAGCAPMAPSAFVRMRMAGIPPRPENCALKFKYQSLQKPWDTSRFTQVGVLGVDLADTEWSEEMKDAVRTKACELGGEVATIAAVNENPMSHNKAALVLVYRATDHMRSADAF